MKTKLEAIANVTVIVLALLIGYSILSAKVSLRRIPRAVMAGDHLGGVPEIDWNQHRRTLILALNTGCHYCQDSVPFYQKLAQAQRPGSKDLQLVAAFPNTAKMVGQFSQQEEFNMRSVAGVSFEKLRVNSTPTLILVNQDGQVEKVWFGILTAKQEMDLLQLAEGT